MKINNKDIQVETNQSSVDFELDNSSGHLFSVLSELYSKPVESTIRELCTNCSDAHIMSNNEDRPFIIKLPNYEENIMQITFRDFGPGLSHDEVMNIYKIYGRSTKTDSDTQTGCLGLGSKSPYSISSTFYVRSYKDGKLSIYTCTMGNNGKPNITDKPKVTETIEENGLEVVIPFYKEVNFIEILKNTLKYFKVKPLVYIQQTELVHDTRANIDWIDLKEEFKLTETISMQKIFKKLMDFISHGTSGTPSRTEAEVVQLQIYYPLDAKSIISTIKRYNKLYSNENNEIVKKFKISNNIIFIIETMFKLGFTLRAKPGKIAFSPSRENIKYTDLTLIYIIKELVKAARNYEKIANSMFAKIDTKEKVFKSILGKDEFYEKIAKYFNITNPKIKKIKKEFDNDINIKHLITLERFYPNTKKVVPAEATYKITRRVGSSINLTVHNNMVNFFLNPMNQYVLDLYDTRNLYINQNGEKNYLFFSTMTDAYKEKISVYFEHFLYDNLKVGIEKALELIELFFIECSLPFIQQYLKEINSSKLGKLLNCFKIDLKDYIMFATNAEREMYILENIEEFKKNKIIDTYLIFRNHSLNMHMYRSEVSFFEEELGDKIMSKIRKIQTSINNVDALTNFRYIDLGKLNIESEVEFTIVDLLKGNDFPKINLLKIESILVDRLGSSMSYIFVKIAHLKESNSKNFNTRYNELIENLEDVKIKYITNFSVSGYSFVKEIFKIKLSREKLDSEIYGISEYILANILAKDFQIFENQVMLGKLDKFPIYKDEILKIGVPEAFIQLKDFQVQEVITQTQNNFDIVSTKSSQPIELNKYLSTYTWKNIKIDQSLIHKLISIIAQQYKLIKLNYYAKYETLLSEKLKINDIGLLKINHIKFHIKETFDRYHRELKNLKISEEVSDFNYNKLLNIIHILESFKSDLLGSDEHLKLEYVNFLRSGELNEDSLLLKENKFIEFKDIKIEENKKFSFRGIELNDNIYYSKIPEVDTIIAPIGSSLMNSLYNNVKSENEIIKDLLKLENIKVVYLNKDQKIQMGKNTWDENQPGKYLKEIKDIHLRKFKKRAFDTHVQTLKNYIQRDQDEKTILITENTFRFFPKSILIKECYNGLSLLLDSLTHDNFHSLEAYSHSEKFFTKPDNLDFTSILPFNDNIICDTLKNILASIDPKDYSKSKKTFLNKHYKILDDFGFKENDSIFIKEFKKLNDLNFLDVLNKMATEKSSWALNTIIESLLSIELRIRLWKNNKNYLKIDKFLEINLDKNLKLLFEEKDLITKEILKFFKVDNDIRKILDFLLFGDVRKFRSEINDYFSVRIRLLNDLKDGNFSLMREILPYKEIDANKAKYRFRYKGISEIDPKFFKFHTKLNDIKDSFNRTSRWEKTFNLDTILDLIEDYKNNFIKKGKIIKLENDSKFDDVINFTLKEKEAQKLNKKINIRTKISNKDKGKNNVFRTTLQLG